MGLKTCKCAICEKEFETAQPHKKYCSLICKEAGDRLRRMKWRSKHPEYTTEYMRQYRQAKREAQKENGN